MPILKKEDDVYPVDLLDNAPLLASADRKWNAIYTLSRNEKGLMRRLLFWQIPFYGPMIMKRFRSPNGRLRTSFVPLFPNYVFLFATESERQLAFTTNYVCRCHSIDDRNQFVTDLRKIRLLVQSGIPLAPESKLTAGNRARIKTGPFTGYEGTVIRREGKTRLLIWVNFIEQGVSLEIDEGLLAPI